MMTKGILGTFFGLAGLTVGFFIRSPDSKPIEIMILIFFSIYIVAFVLTMGPITWLYIPEIVQPPTVTYTTMTNWAFACFIIVFYPIVKDGLGSAIFLIFSLATIFFYFMTRDIMIETKDKK